MATPYVGEIRIFAGTFAPLNWAFCDGQLLPISENETLYQLIGTTYGGDGDQTFALPDLRGRAPKHQGTGSGGSNTYTMGQSGGAEWVTLNVGQIPNHRHLLLATTGSGTTADPAGNILASSPSTSTYVDGVTPGDALAAASVGARGGNLPHDNLMPYLAVNYIISLYGIFPSQT
ncbi:MAG TPA: tail fiber protein [Baekduia sp.]|uniref:phage tail protein n=1 Tax=Baekduia sp. TaxID=2600305 RepID=UPI002D78F105|nr:tail fiber protein [Baekduia sp.]HET6509765.1 tail fiber protein [Baekduia sp.]